jgi:hypothetical protein
MSGKQMLPSQECLLTEIALVMPDAPSTSGTAMRKLKSPCSNHHLNNSSRRVRMKVLQGVREYRLTRWEGTQGTQTGQYESKHDVFHNSFWHWQTGYLNRMWMWNMTLMKLKWTHQTGETEGAMCDTIMWWIANRPSPACLCSVFYFCLSHFLVFHCHLRLHHSEKCSAF